MDEPHDIHVQIEDEARDDTDPVKVTPEYTARHKVPRDEVESGQDDERKEDCESHKWDGGYEIVLYVPRRAVDFAGVHPKERLRKRC